MSYNSSWTLTQTGEARTWTLTQDGESRTFTIAPGVGPVGPAGPSNITTSTPTDITGILKGDGANVGAAVADTDYQSVPAEGAFADGDKTKLDSIESGADVTDAANVNAAGAVMESDYSPAHSILAQQSGTGSPSAVTLGTNAILGRTTGAGTAITGLSASDVRTMLNVEDGATADQTASEILTAIKTVDGTGSGLDADLLDGQEASAFAAASHTHLSADITDATDDGSIPGDRGNLLKTDSSGQVKAFSVFGDLSIGGGFGLIDGDPDGSFTNYGILVGNNITGGRTIELPDAEGTLALTSQTDGSIHAEDLDFAGSTDIGADLADADEILVSDGGGNTTRRKSALSRVWTYIKAKADTFYVGLTGNQTVAGDKTFSGQIELTGQSASTDDSAMTRSLGEDWEMTNLGRQFQINLGAASFTSSGTGAVASGSGGNIGLGSGTSTSGYGRAILLNTPHGLANGAYWNRPIKAAICVAFNNTSVTATNSGFRLWFGATTPPAFDADALSAAGFGVEYAPDGSNYRIRAFAHDGTTYTAGSWVNIGTGSIVTQGHRSLVIESDGSGNISATITSGFGDSSTTYTATTTGGPTSYIGGASALCASSSNDSTGTPSSMFVGIRSAIIKPE